MHPKHQFTGSPLLRCQVDGKLQTLGEAGQNVTAGRGNPVVLDMYSDVPRVYCIHVQTYTQHNLQHEYVQLKKMQEMIRDVSQKRFWPE